MSIYLIFSYCEEGAFTEYGGTKFFTIYAIINQFDYVRIVHGCGNCFSLRDKKRIDAPHGQLH